MHCSICADTDTVRHLFLLSFILGGTFTCNNALTISAESSNVGINIQGITLTGGATLGTCSPAMNALPTSGSPLTPWLDPSDATDKQVVCSVNNPTLTQAHFEAGSVAWNVTVDAVAKGGNHTADGTYTAEFVKTLTQVRKYQLGIQRVEPNNAVTSAGECISLLPVSWKVPDWLRHVDWLSEYPPCSLEPL